MLESNLLYKKKNNVPEAQWPLNGIHIEGWNETGLAKTASVTESGGIYTFTGSTSGYVTVPPENTIDPNLDDSYRLDIEFEITQIRLAGTLYLVTRGIAGQKYFGLSVDSNGNIGFSFSQTGGFGASGGTAVVNQRRRFSFIKNKKNFQAILDDVVVFDKSYPNLVNQSNPGMWMIGTLSNASSQPQNSTAAKNWKLYGLNVRRF